MNHFLIPCRTCCCRDVFFFADRRSLKPLNTEVLKMKKGRGGREGWIGMGLMRGRKERKKRTCWFGRVDPLGRLATSAGR